MTGRELIGNEEADVVYRLLKEGKPLMAHGYAEERDIYYVREFEKAFADYLGVKYACAVSSGTAALYVALKALGVKPGDTVITQCHTFIATVEAILMCDAEPICTEVNKTLNMDPDNLEFLLKGMENAGSTPACVIPVHIGGVPAEMDRILDICGDDVPILEDAAQSLGAKYDGEYVGTIGDAGIFSFDYNKTITTGEGGMIVTNDPEIDYLARQFHDHGHWSNTRVPRGEEAATHPGFNFRMSEIGGAIGIEQLKKLPDALEVQKLNKKWKKELFGVLNLDFREIPELAEDSGESIIWFCDDREKALSLAKGYKEIGVSTRNLPDAIRWCFAGCWGHIFNNTRQWPTSRDLLERAICLPVFLADEEP